MMITPNVIFRGNVQVYLQGNNALLYTQSDDNSGMTYFVGSPSTKIRINDYRRNPIIAAKKAIRGEYVQFAEIFCQPAWVEVKSDENQIEIEMSENDSDGDNPILWMGILENNRMPVRETAWEILRPLNETSTAFAALVW